ncbi:hypothetical protein O181_078584 [Austropuccinia psidii MF-1]|uniref:Uncharacterized protein n=1 Tax=Austropuccinia psidii MF-1 TaxID=1389203 RepID=A0A9Q3IHF2_9BASI|nr:hypothetical protein [Austropuccinia psidii MF-1]
MLDNVESIPKREWTPGAQTGRWEQFGTMSPVPSSIDLSTPLLGHHLMVTSLLDRTKVIIQPMKEGNGKRTFKLGPIVTITKPTKSPSTRLTRLIYALQANPTATHSWPKDLSREPSQNDEQPIPGLSPSSEPADNVPTCEPEPEVAPTQSTEKPFGKQLLHFFNSSQLFLTPPLPISSSSHHYLLGHHH